MAVRKQRKTETLSVSEARKQFSDVITRPLRGEGRVIVEKSGTPVGAIVSIEDVKRLEQMEQEWAEVEDVFRRTQAGFKGTRPDVIEQEVERTISEVEGDYRERRKKDRRKKDRRTEPGG